ncbi:uncharacterized protein LOC112083136 [Eutrema salsugineum]|uniref:uncharacterized protein LOC112083136 n=1 Tax=Eutrema salsugineum TaxID=72664 RepID=UPI000CED4F3B|nr:uncharacterized protein LOC112083136 [Eutrema salsugineum]
MDNTAGERLAKFEINGASILIVYDPKPTPKGIEDTSIPLLQDEDDYIPSKLPVYSSCPDQTFPHHLRTIAMVEGGAQSRNNLIFNKRIPSPSKDVSLSNAGVKEWLEVSNQASLTTTSNLNAGVSQRSQSCWMHPPPGFLKCNVDAAYDPATRNTTAGWVIRDDKGAAKYWGSANLGISSSPIEAEGKALLVAIQNTYMMSFRSVIFEGDCQNLAKNLNNEEKDYTIHNLCKREIERWGAKFHRVQFKNVKRHCNEVAHCLAKNAPPNSFFYSDYKFPPLWLSHALHKDYVISNIQV